jgi:heat shock protein HtpX
MRYLLFFGVNIAIMLMISFVLSLLGINGYMTASGIDYSALMVICLFWGMGGSFISLLISKWIAKKTMGVELIEQGHHYGWVVQAVYSFARSAGITKTPEVGIYHSGELNAFATGPSRNNSLVAVSTGLLNSMSRAEVEGVLAHELAHIKNRDILISSIAAVIAGAISYMAHMAQWAMIFGFGGSSDDDDDGVGLLGSLVMIIVAPIAAMLIQMAISRSREYLADATGARICNCPMSLASALKRLEEWNHRIPMDVNPATAQMYIVNPLTASSVAKLFSTHPPVQERIQRLLEIAGMPAPARA